MLDLNKRLASADSERYNPARHYKPYLSNSITTETLKGREGTPDRAWGSQINRDWKKVLTSKYFILMDPLEFGNYTESGLSPISAVSAVPNLDINRP